MKNFALMLWSARTCPRFSIGTTCRAIKEGRFPKQPSGGGETATPWWIVRILALANRLIRHAKTHALLGQAVRSLGRLSLCKGEGRVKDRLAASPEPLTLILSPPGEGRGDRRDHVPAMTALARRLMLVFIFFFAFVRQIYGLTPGDLSQVKFEQHPGQQVSRGLVFQDESGRAVKLGDLFGKQPLIFVLGYYRCPMLCTLINDGLINALENLRSSVGADFQVVDLSIDPNEQPAAAAEKKALYVRRYGRSGAAAGWHCLVGDEKAIAQLADEVGYRYAYDPQINQYAHPSGVVILTSDGKISRYVFGVTFNSTQLRDALAAAKEGKSGSVLSQLFLLCYHYNPVTGKYGGLILSILRVASVGSVALIAWWVFSMARPSNKEAAQTG
jgi:protein SCO1/2